jgi:hypothetical protein
MYPTKLHEGRSFTGAVGVVVVRGGWEWSRVSGTTIAATMRTASTPKSSGFLVRRIGA